MAVDGKLPPTASEPLLRQKQREYFAEFIEPLGLDGGDHPVTITAAKKSYQEHAQLIEGLKASLEALRQSGKQPNLRVETDLVSEIDYHLRIQEELAREIEVLQEIGQLKRSVKKEQKERTKAWLDAAVTGHGDTVSQALDRAIAYFVLAVERNEWLSLDEAGVTAADGRLHDFLMQYIAQQEFFSQGRSYRTGPASIPFVAQLAKRKPGCVKWLADQLAKVD